MQQNLSIMEKFIILYEKGLYGAVVGTESGEVLSITNKQRNNQEWIENHTSKELKVFRFSNFDEISNSYGSFHLSPQGVLDHDFVKLETFTVKESRFIIMFQGYFSSGTKTWIIEEEPDIQP